MHYLIKIGVTNKLNTVSLQSGGIFRSFFPGTFSLTSKGIEFDF